jgi:T5orf172 domain
VNKQKFVYFIRPIGMDGPIKIGCSDTPAKRLATFAPWAPYPLELIGAVPGESNDENFLHRAFANVHSHREWFHSSPELRAAIKTIIESNSVDAARKFLKAKRTIRKSARIVRAPEHQKFLDLQTQVYAAETKLRKSLGKDGAYGTPSDVAKIVRRWNAQVYRGAGFAPTAQELERVNAYLADPASHSIIPEWKKKVLIPWKKDSICIPVVLTDEEIAA